MRGGGPIVIGRGGGRAGPPPSWKGGNKPASGKGPGGGSGGGGGKKASPRYAAVGRRPSRAAAGRSWTDGLFKDASMLADNPSKMSFAKQTTKGGGVRVISQTRAVVRAPRASSTSRSITMSNSSQGLQETIIRSWRWRGRQGITEGSS